MYQACHTVCKHGGAHHATGTGGDAQQGLCEARLGCRDGSPQLGAPGPESECTYRHCIQAAPGNNFLSNAGRIRAPGPGLECTCRDLGLLSGSVKFQAWQTLHTSATKSCCYYCRTYEAAGTAQAKELKEALDELQVDSDGRASGGYQWPHSAPLPACVHKVSD